MGRGGGRCPVAGDPVEVKRSPVGYPIGLLVLLRGVCQYLPDHIGERLVLVTGLLVPTSRMAFSSASSAGRPPSLSPAGASGWRADGRLRLRGLILLGSPLFLLLEKQEAGLHQVELHSLQPVVNEAAFFFVKKLIDPCYGQLQCRYQLFHMSSSFGFFRGEA